MTKLIYKKNLPNGLFEVYSEKPSFKYKNVHQVHEATIVDASTINNDKLPDADGLYSHNSKEVLAIVTADCIPIVVFGKKGHAHLHAGWRGVEKSIMLQQEVIELEPTYFFLGPHIQQCCFEVGQEFTKNFHNSDNFKQIEDKLYFNLAKETEDRIKKVFPQAIVEHAGTCTCCKAEFHSYRRNKTEKRNWNILKSNIL